MRKWTERELMRLALETGIGLGTVRKWTKGGAVNEANDKSLLRAVAELGMVEENDDHAESA